MEMVTSWNYNLVALSFVIAMIGSYVALDFAVKMKTAHGTRRKICFVLGALTMGLAIWTMHFIGMLALNMNMPVSYDITLSTLSMLAAAIGAGIAFFIMNQRAMESLQLGLGSIAMGMAIVIMHYMGMASMQMSAMV